MPNQMKTKEEIYLEYLANYYRKHFYFIPKVIIPIVNNKNRKDPDTISLRLIEAFIFKYCRHRKVFIEKKDGSMLSVYDSYQNQLQSYDKKYFDIFKRSRHLLFKYAENQFFETTIGQLNFFRWLTENEILSYIETHKEKIRKEIKIINETILTKHRY